MLRRSLLVRHPLSGRRLRVVLLLILLFLAVALAWHLVGMADHRTGMMGACFALLVMAGVVSLLGEPLLLPIALPPERGQRPLPVDVPSQTGRSPPTEGTVLLM